jgi:hypothetical protein
LLSICVSDSSARLLSLCDHSLLVVALAVTNTIVEWLEFPIYVQAALSVGFALETGSPEWHFLFVFY